MSIWAETDLSGCRSISVSDDQTIISARLESAVDLHQPVPNMASYDAIGGRLTLPSIGIDGEIHFRNIVLSSAMRPQRRFVCAPSNNKLHPR